MSRESRDTLADVIAIVCDVHYDTVEIELDIPLPIDVGTDWLDRAALEVRGVLDGPQVMSRPAEALATIAYDLSRTLHQQLCPPGSGSCRTDTKAASDLVSVVARIYLHLQLTHGLRVVGARFLEAPFLDRVDAIRGLEAALTPLLHAFDEDGTTLGVVTTTPIVQLNTAISDVDDDEYLNLRRLAIQIQGVLEQGPFNCQVTSDYATPASRAGFVSEASVRARIYRISCMVLFSKHAGDGSSIAWTLAEELNVPTLVLREPGDHSAAARFPGQLCSREVCTYRSPDEAVVLIGDFLKKYRLRIEARARQVYEYSTLDTEHLNQRMNQIDPDAFDASPITWERARFFVDSPIHWFQAPRPTSDEIAKVLGLPSSSQLGANQADGTRSATRTDGGESEAGIASERPATRQRRALSTASVKALLRAAEAHDISYADQDLMIERWERPGVLAPISPLDRGPTYETWVRMYDEMGR